MNKHLIPIPKTELTILLAQLSRLDSAIEKEFSLVSDRMNWMVISESFIFGAFATASTNYSTTTHLKSVVIVLLLFLPILGIIVAFLARSAIFAAHKACDTLKRKRANLERYIQGDFYTNLISSDEVVHLRGNHLPQYLSLGIMIFWMLISTIAIIQLIEVNQIVYIGILGIVLTLIIIIEIYRLKIIKMLIMMLRMRSGIKL
jgi:hypothetical protein